MKPAGSPARVTALPNARRSEPDTLSSLSPPPPVVVVEHPLRAVPGVGPEPVRGGVISKGLTQSPGERHPTSLAALGSVLATTGDDLDEPTLKVDVLPLQPKRLGLAAHTDVTP